jgi:transposase
MGIQLVLVRFAIVAGQNAAVDRRMQRLDAPIEDFGKASDIAHRATGQPGVAEHPLRIASRDQFDAERNQVLRTFDNAGFIRHANQRTHSLSLSFRV